MTEMLKLADLWQKCINEDNMVRYAVTPPLLVTPRLSLTISFSLSPAAIGVVQRYLAPRSQLCRGECLSTPEIYSRHSRPEHARLQDDQYDIGELSPLDPSAAGGARCRIY